MTAPAHSAHATSFQPVKLSLASLLGDDYVEAMAAANSALTGAPPANCHEVVECYPQAMAERLHALLPEVGTALTPGLPKSALGAGPQGFSAATKVAMAPLSTYGWYRLAENGKLYLTAKSEHYHTPLGHAFPGFRLVDLARRLGIPNATHNNTRGHITRRLEEALIRAANGGSPGQLDRVLNLETGSLAAEAALKMILARFYPVQDDSPAPPYAGRIPVFIVMGNDDGGLQANYHGTTMLTQTMRGMWPTLFAKLVAAGVMKVLAVRPNDHEGLAQACREAETAPNKLAGAFHEVIMMNYGARVLTPAFLRDLYERCARHDAPTVVDEIQSGLWHHDLFMFREYGLRPDMVAVGKGFPAGEYAASRLIFNSRYDSLPQFGALVTNGQEELASLSYLVSMAWAQANAQATRTIGEYYEARLRELGARHAGVVQSIEGRRHLSAISFTNLVAAKGFCERLNQRGLDISAQTYKANCPPTALTKLPLIASARLVDFVLDRMAEALGGL